jgi:hypothetical protein
MTVILLAFVTATASGAVPLGAGAVVGVAEAELAALPTLAAIPALSPEGQKHCGRMLVVARGAAADSARLQADAVAALLQGRFRAAARYYDLAAKMGGSVVSIATSVRSQLGPKVER